MTDGAASACPGILTKTIGSKIILTKMVDGSRAFLHSQVYLWIMRTLGLLLIIYALTFLQDGLVRLGVWTP